MTYNVVTVTGNNVTGNDGQRVRVTFTPVQPYWDSVNDAEVDPREVIIGSNADGSWSASIVDPTADGSGAFWTLNISSGNDVLLNEVVQIGHASGASQGFLSLAASLPSADLVSYDVQGAAATAQSNAESYASAIVATETARAEAAEAASGGSAASYSAIGLLRQTEFNIADYGAVANGYSVGTTTYNVSATDNTTAIQNCLNAAGQAGGTVVIPPFPYATDQLTVPDSVSIRGISRKQSVLILKSASENGNLLVSAGFGTGSAATSTDDSWAGTSYLNIENISLDGNQVNQSVSSGQSDYRNQFAVVKLYTWHMILRGIDIRNAKENGLYTEHANSWDDTFNEYQFAESLYDGLFIKNFGGAGWCNRGPHDSRASSVYISSYNAGGTDAYAGYVQESNGNYGSPGMILHNLHCWGQFSTNAVYISGSNILDGFIYAEGATQAAMYLTGVSGSKFTVTCGYATAGVELAGSSVNNYIEASCQSNLSAGLFRLDGAITGNTLIHTQGSGNPAGAIFDLSSGTYSGGNNSFISNHPNNATMFAGTAAVTDRVDIRNDKTPNSGSSTLFALPLNNSQKFSVSDGGVNFGAVPITNVGSITLNSGASITGGNALVSVFGRTGAVVAASGDYSSFYDALGAAATAQSNAETYAASQASAAQSNAETYAVAQASAAQAAAIAASDSVGSASAALANAQAYVDAERNALAPTGAISETFSRVYMYSVSFQTPASGTLYCRAIMLPAGQLISNLAFVTGSGVQSGGSHGWYVLLDANRVVRAVTADQTASATWGAATTAFPLSVAASAYTTTYTGLYYVGFCAVSTGMPSLVSGTGTSTPLIALPPILMATSSTGQTTPPGLGSTMGALTAGGAFDFYAYVS